MILDKILARKEQEVAEAREKVPLAELQQSVAGLAPTRGFADALRRKASGGTAVIAEVKKGSPSKGIIREDFDPEAIAAAYERAGAACLSVLTDRDFFFGDLAYLHRIAGVVRLPLLRKDFIVDRYQVYEARAAGADAVLLIAAALDLGQLQELTALATELDLDVLMEVHDEAELEVALQTPAELIGINNRNLQTFEVSLEVTERLLPAIPGDRLVVAESGIVSRADIRRLQRAGAGAFLIGESLMRETDIEGKLQELLHD